MKTSRSWHQAHIERLTRDLAKERLANVRWQQSFGRYYSRSMKAITLWQKAHPGNDLVWPDLGRLFDWLTSGMKKGTHPPFYERQRASKQRRPAPSRRGTQRRR